MLVKGAPNDSDSNNKITNSLLSMSVPFYIDTAVTFSKLDKAILRNKLYKNIWIDVRQNRGLWWNNKNISWSKHTKKYCIYTYCTVLWYRACVTTVIWRCRKPLYQWLLLGNRLAIASNRHCNDVIISAIVSQITGFLFVYSTVCSGANHRKTSKLGVTGLCEENLPATM